MTEPTTMSAVNPQPTEWWKKSARIFVTFSSHPTALVGLGANLKVT
jgi:hypothetical protein